ncbi:MAG: outer membrane beta-barrel protein, partial [Pseudomonadota bacterium]
PPSATQVPQRLRGAPEPRSAPTDDDLGAGFQTRVVPPPLTDFATTTEPADPAPPIVPTQPRPATSGATTNPTPTTAQAITPPSVGGPLDNPLPRAPLDGDFSAPVTAPAPVDGDFSDPPVNQPVDGEDPTGRDDRDDTDRAAFLSPPAGFDPSLFAIEVSPILSERPRQLFRFQPYTPIGVRAGSFVILPSVEIGSLYDSNVFEAPDAQSDVAVEIVPTVRIVSNWNVHALELRATGVLSRFRDFDTENQNAYTLEARGRLDITRRTNLEGLVLRDVAQESRSDINAVSGADERADTTRDQYALTLNHRFNRLRLQLRGSHTIEDVSETATDTNEDRNERETEIALRASWEFKPTLFAFAETAVNVRRFEAPSADDGISRDSRGARYRVGVSFGNTDQILRGEISVGFGTQTPDDSQLDDVSGLLVDANLAWRISGLTTMLFNASTNFDDSTDANVSGVITRNAGVELRHSFRRNIIANAGLGYEHRDFIGPSQDEAQLTALAGLEYLMNRHVTLFGRYQFTDFYGATNADDYQDHEVRVGMRLSR